MLISYQKMLNSWIIPLFIEETKVAPDLCSFDEAGSGEDKCTYETPVSDNPYNLEVFFYDFINDD